MNRIFGSDLPPGCSLHDIDRACGVEEDGSEEADTVFVRFDPLIDRVADVRKLLARDLREALDATLQTVDELARDRLCLERFLESALAHVPPDPLCKSAGGIGGAPHADESPVTGTILEIGEPTLRGEIEQSLAAARDRRAAETTGAVNG
jgi:hypothetical protein